MPPKTPDFWRERGKVSTLLLPIAALYQIGAAINALLSKPYDSSLPVICVGGIVAGGSGKTPTVHTLLDLIENKGIYHKPVILTRGYGGFLHGPTMVDPEVHSARDVGDEALLHVRHAPTVIARDRAAGARLAEAMGADVILLDDGLQNPSLIKDISFLVIDAKQGLGNERILPAGPLRESLHSALRKCDAVIETNGRSERDYGRLPVIEARYEITSEHDKTASYTGFAGLGVPEKFKDTLEQNGFRLSGFKPFADHHPYSIDDMEALLREARGSRLITTKKDSVRIPPPYLDKVDVVTIRAVFDAPDKIAEILR